MVLFHAPVTGLLLLFSFKNCTCYKFIICTKVDKKFELPKKNEKMYGNKKTAAAFADAARVIINVLF
jgi:hypothetical protein